MDLQLLRSATRAEHEATEGVMPRFDAVFGRAEYVSALVGMYGAVRGWDVWAEVWAPADLREMVRARRRGPALERDLEFFGAELDGDPPGRSLRFSQRTGSPGGRMDGGAGFGTPGCVGAGFGETDLGTPGLDEEARTWRAARGEEARRAAFLGMMYVVEGSTLGGQYIARRAEEVLGLTPGEGDAFFRGAGEGTGERWREFRGVLGAVPEELTEVVVGAARDMFGFFRGCLVGVVGV